MNCSRAQKLRQIELVAREALEVYPAVDERHPAAPGDSLCVDAEPRQLKAAATKTLILTGIAMGADLPVPAACRHAPVCDSRRPLDSLMAWLPVFIFGPVSVYLLDRVKS